MPEADAAIGQRSIEVVPVETGSQEGRPIRSARCVNSHGRVVVRRERAVDPWAIHGRPSGTLLGGYVDRGTIDAAAIRQPWSAWSASE
jgi:hypothetical protein